MGEGCLRLERRIRGWEEGVCRVRQTSAMALGGLERAAAGEENNDLHQQ